MRCRKGSEKGRRGALRVTDSVYDAAAVRIFGCATGSTTMPRSRSKLTVNEVEDQGPTTRFTVNVIPHTATHTTLGELVPGRQLNVEIDVLARYIERMLAVRSHERA